MTNQATERSTTRADLIDTSRRGFLRDLTALGGAGDFEAQASIFTADAVYSPPMAPPVRGRDSIRAVLERTMPPGVTADVQPMEVRILGPDWVYEFGTRTLTFTPRRDQSAAERDGHLFDTLPPDGKRLEGDARSVQFAPAAARGAVA